MLRNPRAHGHRRAAGTESPLRGVPLAAPSSPEELDAVLRGWAAAGVTRIVVDGGDGTVRDVLGRLPEAFAGAAPELAVLSSGKTNALAHDLGRGRRLSLDAALGSLRTTTRPPLEIAAGEGGAPVRRGFVFGAGVFPGAIGLAQHLHRAGLFGGLAVGGALAAAGARVIFGPPDDPWRIGWPLRVERDGAVGEERNRLLLLLSSLERLPLGVRPFGPQRRGLKLLEVEASPRRLLSALPLVLSGRDRPWLRAAGYRRADVDALRLHISGSFVLDGELFDGGDLRICAGAPVTFVLP